MSSYFIVKWVHIVSSVLLVGTGFGSAFYLFFANRSGQTAALAVVTRLVVRADLWFTTPAVIVQPVTGAVLMHLSGWHWSTPWIMLSFGLYVFAGACWLPVLWLQARMANMAHTALSAGTPPPALYWHYARWWERLGYPAFVAMLIVYYLMVVKPQIPILG